MHLNYSGIRFYKNLRKKLLISGNKKNNQIGYFNIIKFSVHYIKTKVKDDRYE